MTAKSKWPLDSFLLAALLHQSPLIHVGDYCQPQLLQYPASHNMIMEVLPSPIRKMGGEAGYFKIQWKYRRKMGVEQLLILISQNNQAHLFLSLLMERDFYIYPHFLR